MLSVGCSGEEGTAPSPTSVIDSDLAFAAPWQDLVDDRLRALGFRAVISAPEAIDHARAQLTGATTSTARTALRDACLDDGRTGAMSELDGWLAPTTLAGLLAALGASTV